MTLKELKKMIKRKYYSNSLKLRVLRDYAESGQSRKAISLKFGIDPTLISHWVRIFEVEKAHIKENVLVVPIKKSKIDRESAMEQRIRDLESSLKKKDKELFFEKLRTHTLNTIIDGAIGEQLNIQIRKKTVTKQ